MRKYHARCGPGENGEIISNYYLSESQALFSASADAASEASKWLHTTCESFQPHTQCARIYI
jgi:hypothetical protein